MLTNDWLLLHWMQSVRDDLYAVPPDHALCFYGNPLGVDVAKSQDLCSKDLLLLMPSGGRQALWPLLVKLSDSNERNGVVQLLKSNFMQGYRSLWAQMLLWEWAYSERYPQSRRLQALKQTDSVPHRLLDGYYRTMCRALESTGHTLQAVPPQYLPLVLFDQQEHIVADSVDTAALDFLTWRDDVYATDKRRQQKRSFQLVGVPAHVGLLLLPKLRRRDGNEDNTEIDRGARLRAHYMASAEKGDLVHTPGGLHLDQWPAGSKKRAVSEPDSCVPAKLMIAVAIERWFHAETSLRALLIQAQEKAIGNMDKSPFLGAESPTTPPFLSVSLPLPALHSKSERRFVDEDLLQTEILMDGAIGMGEVQPVVEVTLRVPPWLPLNWPDYTAVIHTIATRQQREEVEFAEVLEVEDLDADGDIVCIRLATMHHETPLLDAFASASRTVVKGYIGMRRIGGQLRPVLGVSVALSM